MKHARFLLLALTSLASLSMMSCTSDEPKKRKPVPPGANSELSSLPWNRPPAWEGSARYGSAVPQSR